MFSNNQQKLSKDQLIVLLQEHKVRFYKLNLKLEEVDEAFQKEIDQYDDNDDYVHITDRIENNFNSLVDLLYLPAVNAKKPILGYSMSKRV